MSHAGLNNELRPFAQGDLPEVPLLCQPYVRESGPNSNLIPNTDETNCATLNSTNVENEYGKLVCPDTSVTEVDISNQKWQVRFWCCMLERLVVLAVT